MKIGAQLFTVRDYTKNLTDFSETLKKISEIGYTAVQVSATCGFEAEWLSEQLKKNGLVCSVTHTNPERIANDPDKVAEEHKAFGCGIVGIGYAPGGFQGGIPAYENFRDIFSKAAKTLNSHGITLGYHNHQFEFERIDGLNFIERMKRDFDKDELVFILDTYWVQFAGGNPAEWIKKLKGRVPTVHFKDMRIEKLEQKMAPIGEGNINWGKVISACEDSGTQFILVEQDDCYGENPFDCLKRSYDYLKSLGLE